jgi:hypothetical protein
VRLAHSGGMFAFADGPRIGLSLPLLGDVPEVVPLGAPDVVAPRVPDVVAPVVPDVVAPVVPDVVPPIVPDVVVPVVPDVVAPVVPDVVAPVVPDVVAPVVPDDVPDDVCALADTANARAIAVARAQRVNVFMSNSSCLRLATPDPIGRAMLAIIA